MWYLSLSYPMLMPNMFRGNSSLSNAFLSKSSAMRWTLPVLVSHAYSTTLVVSILRWTRPRTTCAAVSRASASTRVPDAKASAIFPHLYAMRMNDWQQNANCSSQKGRGDSFLVPLVFWLETYHAPRVASSTLCTCSSWCARSPPGSPSHSL